MAWLRRRRTYGAGRGPAGGRARWGAAQAVSLVTAVIVGLIVLGILLVLLEANRDNGLVDWILEAGEFFVEPFDNIFSLDTVKARVAVNWGIGALIYAAIGSLIARVLLR
jgi:hypothetical protein